LREHWPLATILAIELAGPIFMKRYAVCYMSTLNNVPMMISETDNPTEAYKGALKAQKDGLRDVRVADTQQRTSHDAKAFAAMHRL
jgi:hypothetical protein